jgi:CDP-diacylglycerol--serine O-phosphatidyltransferase
MMNIKKHIPNAITCGNLLCGCLGILVTSWYKLDFAFFFIVLAAFLDFFDGFFARILKVTSPIGKDLDSLADMVTFGVLPGFIMFKMISLTILGFNIELAQDIYSSFRIGEPTIAELEKSGVTVITLFLPFIAFLIPIFSAIRLAKFNNDLRQSDSFIGVPTPANAILIASLAFILMSQLHWKNTFEYPFFYKTIHLIGLTLLMSYLLVAELPLFALKFKNFGWADNKIRYSFLIISVILLILFQFIAIPFIIFLYIVLSILNNRMNKTQTLKH